MIKTAVPYERDADFASDARFLGTDWSVAKEIQVSVHSPWYFIETFGLPWTSYEMRLYNVRLGWQVDLFFMTQDEEDETQVYSGYHQFPGVYYTKIYYNKTLFDHICSAEVLGKKIHVPCNYEAVLETEYGPEWVTPDEHHFLIRQKRRHLTYWDQSESMFAFQCLGRQEFDIRDQFKYSDYKYSPQKEKRPQRENKAMRQALVSYKAVSRPL